MSWSRSPMHVGQRRDRRSRRSARPCRSRSARCARTWFSTWWMLIGAAVDRPAVGEGLHAVDQGDDAVGLLADQAGQLALGVAAPTARGAGRRRGCPTAGSSPRAPAWRRARSPSGRRCDATSGGRCCGRSICSTSETATRPSLSTIGDRRSAQNRLPMRGEASVTPFSATAPPVVSTCSSSEKSGVSSGTNSSSGWPTRRARPAPKNCSADEVGVVDQPSRIDHDDRLRQRIEERRRELIARSRWRA